MINLELRTKEDMERFLYGCDEIRHFCTNEQLEWIENVENALNMRLFRWQKYAIIGIPEWGRRTGKSLAWALQRLRHQKPIDMTKEACERRSHRQMFNYKLLVEVATKLDAFNVPHAPICKTKAELYQYMSVYENLRKRNELQLFENEPITLRDDV